MNDRAELAPDFVAEFPLHLRFPARAALLKQVRRSVRDALGAAQCSEDFIADVVIAIDEACQNIIRHAYGGDTDQEIDLDLSAESGTLIVRLEDDAAAIDAAKIEPRNPEDMRPGGLGTYFMREIMDTVEYDAGASGRGNILTMRKKIG